MTDYRAEIERIHTEWLGLPEPHAKLYDRLAALVERAVADAKANERAALTVKLESAIAGVRDLYSGEAAREREECARTCERMVAYRYSSEARGLTAAAAAIRARANQEGA